MRKPLLTLALLPLLSLAVAPAADADHRDGVSWAVASSFRVGGADVSLVAGRRGGYAAPVYYYRTPRRLPAYYGHRCTDRCFLRGGHFYHSVGCPLVDAYFHRYGFAPARFWIAVGSPYVPHRYVPHRFVPPPHRYGWVPPGHRKHRGHGHHGHHGRGHGRGHDRGHWEWDDGRWKWDD